MGSVKQAGRKRPLDLVEASKVQLMQPEAKRQQVLLSTVIADAGRPDAVPPAARSPETRWRKELAGDLGDDLRDLVATRELPAAAHAKAREALRWFDAHAAEQARRAAPERAAASDAFVEAADACTKRLADAYGALPPP